MYILIAEIRHIRDTYINKLGGVGLSWTQFYKRVLILLNNDSMALNINIDLWFDQQHLNKNSSFSSYY